MKNSAQRAGEVLSIASRWLSMHRWSCSVANKHFGSIFAVHVFLLLCTAASGQSKIDKAVPEPCDTSKNLYVAIGRTVLILPGGNKDYIDILGPNQGRLAPIDPTQSVGCYANPLQRPAIYWPLRLYAPFLTAMNIDATRPLDRNALLLGKGHFFEDTRRYQRDYMCDPRRSIRQVRPDVEMCVGILSPPLQPQFDSGNFISWEFNQKYFPTFDRNNLLFSCPEDLRSAVWGSCEGAVAINQDVEIDLKFVPPRDGYADFASRMKELLFAINAQINQRILPNYPWPSIEKRLQDEHGQNSPSP